LFFPERRGVGVFPERLASRRVERDDDFLFALAIHREELVSFRRDGGEAFAQFALPQPARPRFRPGRGQSGLWAGRRRLEIALRTAPLWPIGGLRRRRAVR